jgi:hypothetical protein
MSSWIARAACGDMARRILKALLLLALAAGAVDLYRSDKALFVRPAVKVDHYRDRISRDLSQRHDLALLFTADDLPGTDWVSGREVAAFGTEAVPGRFGTALRFDGSRRTLATLPLTWNELGSNFTIAIRVNLDAASRDQEILFTRERQPLGLKLDRGHLSFFVSTGQTFRAAAYEFTDYGRFVQVVVVMDVASGQLRLYQDGMLKAELPVTAFEGSETRLALGRSTATLVGEPLMGEVDEILAWRRALAPAEIAAVAERSAPALTWLTPRYYRSYRWATTGQAAISQALKLADRFNPTRHAARLRRAPVPEVNLVLSKSDLRHFVRAHSESQRSGRRVLRAAAPRRIEAIEDGRGKPARLFLDGSDSYYAPGPRRSYIVEPAEGEVLLGSRLLCLRPPESAGWLGPLLETRVARELGIPAISNGLCRLIVNGETVGLYYYEDYATLGVPPGWSPEVFSGRGTPKEWKRLSLEGVPPLARADLARLRAGVERDYRHLLLLDNTSPLSGREMEYRLRQDAARLDRWPLDERRANAPAPERAGLVFNAFAVLGSNPSPQYVLHDLALPTQLEPGVTVSWSSSDPEVIGSDGRVRRPADRRPRAVTMSARLSAGVDFWTNQLVFRVMPYERKLPALFLWAREPLSRLQRVDCAALYYPEGTSDVPRHWLAAQDERSGVSLRGNSSLRQRKKPLGLRLPAPHGLWGTTNICKINLVNPWRDPALVRNRLCYSLFARFARPGHPRFGLPLEWMEVFANGRYHGLLEAIPPVREEWLGLEPYQEGDLHPAVVFKAQRTAPSMIEPRRLMRQTEPSRRHGSFPEPVVELQRFIDESPPDVFAREVDRWLDLDNLVDFQLLLDFSENYNGWPFDFSIHEVLVRPSGPDSRFFLVPFDFDTTWDSRPVGKYHSQIFDRLMAHYPGYRERLADRWRELRAGPLADAAIATDLAQYQERLDGYISWDDERYGQADQPHAARMDTLRRQIWRRLSELDRRFGTAPVGGLPSEGPGP